MTEITPPYDFPQLPESPGEKYERIAQEIVQLLRSYPGLVDEVERLINWFRSAP